MTQKELIKAIADYHPASEAGKKRGWNEYTGGMKDSGSWHILKMLDATNEELQQCLDELIEEWKPRPPRVLTEEEKMLSETWHTIDGKYAYNLLAKKDLENWNKERATHFINSILENGKV